MKRWLAVVAALLMFSGLAGVAHADLDGFMAGLNVQARADMDGFSVKVGGQFGIPVPDVKAIIKAVETPADAFMCFQLSEWTDVKPDVVVKTYKKNKGKGWGVIAKELGIKPGSDEFHRLKAGELSLTGKPSGSHGKSRGGEGGKHKGKKK